MVRQTGQLPLDCFISGETGTSSGRQTLSDPTLAILPVQSTESHLDPRGLQLSSWTCLCLRADVEKPNVRQWRTFTHPDIPVDNFPPCQTSMQCVWRQIEADRVSAGLLTKRKKVLVKTNTIIVTVSGLTGAVQDTGCNWEPILKSLAD